MKTLCLVRHAKATQQMSDLADIDRPLVERGYRDAHTISKKLAATGFSPDLIMTSTGIRALTTALIFARNLGYDSGRVVLTDILYNATAEQVLDSLLEIPDEVERVMVFGHNPSITNAVNLMVKELIEHVPTSGVAGITLDIKKWDQLQHVTGKLQFFEFPKSF
jgi:phosphohistidine phosphatase